MLNDINRKILTEMIVRSKSSTVTKINRIQKEKARNILRGIILSNFKSLQNGLEKIRINCSKNDYKMALLLIRSDPTYINNEYGKLFNDSCPRAIKHPANYNISEIKNQIALNRIKLEEVINLSKKVLIELKSGNFISALEKCNDLKEADGVSIFMIRVISYIVNRYQLLKIDDSEVLSKVDKLKSEIKITKSRFIWEVISQLSNLRTSHMTICKRINDLDSNFQNGYIAKFFINPIPLNQDIYEKTANAFFSFSLFDAYLYLGLIQSLEIDYLNKEKNNLELESKFTFFSGLNFEPLEMYEKVDEDTSYYYLRECFLFIEQKRALKFLAIHGYYYSYYNNQKILPLLHRQLINDYFSELKSLTDLRSKSCENITIVWDKYSGETCGMLENSSALVHLITKKEGRLNEEEQLEFVKLMTFTKDIGEICHPIYLENISFYAKTELVKLVSQCLITIHKKKQYADHDLRSTIQEYCINHFDGDLIKLLEYLHNESPAVTEHLVITCNETFLSKLFHLMERPVDALKLRADMLEWFGKMQKDERYIERAKTLRVDIQINKEKGTIDDSRIYVDPLKFSQWFEDSMVSKFTMDLDNLIISNVNNLKFETFGKDKTIGPWDNVIEHIFLCYREFCDNKSFGIASYLGRRIRHGTFKGLAESGMKEILKDRQYKVILEDKEFNENYNIWLTDYFSMVEALVKDSLQIKSKKKPNGLITTEIDNSYKTKVAKQLVNEILTIYSKESGVIQLPSIIIDYCWRMVEYDLAKTRKLLSEKKSSHGVFSFSPKCSDLQTKRLYSKFIQDVNSLTGQKFRQMASWFNKPSYASPSTDIYLLFNAVISEVKDRVTDFRPIIDVGDKSFSVNGGTYYVIYDAISVLIYNAAYHGKKDGKILFLVTYNEDDDSIKIDLKTEIISLEEMSSAKQKIEIALANSDEDAYVIENNSGIKKLKKLEREGSVSNVNFYVIEKNLFLCFDFTFKLGNRGKYHDNDC